MEFLLGSEGGYVREIVVDELAKGLDAAWRLAADDARAQLSNFLKVGFECSQIELENECSNKNSMLSEFMLTMAGARIWHQ